MKIKLKEYKCHITKRPLEFNVNELRLINSCVGYLYGKNSAILFDDKIITPGSVEKEDYKKLSEKIVKYIKSNEIRKGDKNFR